MNTSSKVQWFPFLDLQGEPLPDGATASYQELLPGSFDTSAQAMAAAVAAIDQRPEAIGISVKRVEVHQ
ncbi:hypothetical protein [Comamonas thiooxydans]|nr:hypothetical protein [Comamonas thiooxydans]UUE92490.1 hypothetical protein MJ608_16235 [Comamonas thiooxydans]